MRLALVLVPAAFATVVNMPRLPIECHSFNDIDIWPQLLRKGVRYIKTDISYCTLDACLSFSTFNSTGGSGSLTDCFHGRDGNVYCCICMRGDASTRPYLVSPFNTTWDMINFFSDPARLAAGYIPTSLDPNPLKIGLDFGGENIDFMNETESAMARMFLLDLRQAIDTYSVGVTPYFDAGMSGWFQELDQLCSAGSCTPWQEEIQSIPWPSESGDSLPPQSSDPFNRFQILNSDEDNLAVDCNTSSWNVSRSKADGYPYLWYEPSSQIEYVGFFDFWAACPTVPAEKRSPNLGVVVVSNQAPEMFETFASSGIGRGANSLILPDNFTNPLLLVVSTLPTSGFDRAAVVSIVGSSNMSSIQVYGIVDGDPPSVVLARASVDGLFVSSLSQWPASADGSAFILATETAGRYCLLVWNVTRMALQPRSSGSIAQPSTTILSSHLMCAPDCVILSLAQSATGVQLDIWNLSGFIMSSTLVAANVTISGGASLGVVPGNSSSVYDALMIYSVTETAVSRNANYVEKALGAACMRPREATVAGKLTEAGCDKKVLSSAWREALKSPNDAAATVRGALYGAYANLVKSSEQNYTVSVTARATRIGFGTGPHVNLAIFNGSTMALLTNTHGTCQCGLLMNNDDTPHCLLPTPDSDSDPLLSLYQSVQFLLNYNFGKLSAFQQLINGSYDAVIDNSLGMCHSEIMSGKFESGASVTAALYERLVAYVNSTEAPDGGPVPELTIMALHDGNVICPILTTVVCGSPFPKAGIVFDQFRLVQPNRLP
jgi:hypothetical protein